MSSFGIKLIAAVSMLIDHAGCVLGYTNTLNALPILAMRSLGRMAFPLYAFLLVNGFEHSHNRLKYLKRLFLFAAVSQMPFSLAVTQRNYSPLDALSSFAPKFTWLFFLGLIAFFALYFITEKDKRDKGFFLIFIAAYLLRGFTLKICGILLISAKLNVFYTLAVSLMLMMLAEKWRESEKFDIKKLIATVCLCLLCYSILAVSDYGIKGALLVLLLYFTRRNRTFLAIAMSAWCIMEYMPLNRQYICLFVGAMCALAPIMFFNGSEGKKTRIFYYIYPIHLLIFAFVGLFIL